MHEHAFYQYRRDLEARATEIMEQASSEYAAAGDKFFNFKQVGNMLRQNPLLQHLTETEAAYIVACVYFLKHVFSMVRNVSVRENMEGRFIDARNYIDILAGLHKEASKEDQGGQFRSCSMNNPVYGVEGPA